MSYLSPICEEDPRLSKRPTIYFIDKETYTTLASKSFNFDEYSKVIYNTNDKTLSTLTKGSLAWLDRQLSELFYHTWLSDEYANTASLSNQEFTYIKDTFKATQLRAISPYGEDKKYYEIIVCSNNTILVVVGESFLSFMIESKDNLLKFILDILRHQYKFTLSISRLLKLYISLKFSDARFNLIRTRFDLL